MKPRARRTDALILCIICPVGATGPVYLGASKNADRRLEQLGSASPQVLELFFCLRTSRSLGFRTLEVVRRRLAVHVFHNRWYSLTPEMAAMALLGADRFVAEERAARRKVKRERQPPRRMALAIAAPVEITDDQVEQLARLGYRIREIAHMTPGEAATTIAAGANVARATAA
ncbi:MAG: hypothetical protein ACLQJR_05175 [Stellaceae bacterium]